jgi:hypothetical protein
MAEAEKREETTKSQTPLEQTAELLRRIIAVPKSEADAKARIHAKDRRRKRARSVQNGRR